MTLLVWVWVLVSCVAPIPEVQVAPQPAGVDVSATVPLHQIVIHDESGQVIVRHRPAAPQSRVFVPARLGQGQRVRVVTAGQEHWAEVPTAGPVDVRVQAPLGGAEQGVVSGQEVTVAMVDAASLQAGLTLTAREPSEVVIEGLGGAIRRRMTAAGQRELIPFEVRSEPQTISVRASGQQTTFTVTPMARDPRSLQQALSIASSVFPTDPLGEAIPARPRDRVQLVPGWWRALLETWGLGYRAQDEQMPWAWQGVRLVNRDPVDWTVLVEAKVVDGSGRVAEGFRPVIRGEAETAARVLMRIPAGESGVATLPVFVAQDRLPDRGTFTRRVTVTPLGGRDALATVDRPLVVQRGSVWSTAGLVLASMASLLGWLWLGLRLRERIRALATSQLVTIGLFGALTWVAGAVLQVVGLGVSTLLGPFAPLLTGIPDDALRACLLGTLLTLIPRRGVAALATCVGFTMRGLTTGAFHPVDLLYLGSTVFWLESWLWASGVTRGEAWREQSGRWVWARLAMALGGSNVCGMATGLVVSVAFYRLYYADWYVALMLALPGFAYVVVGCALAVPFARSLRRVEG